jgi:capsular polysaccharide export protein
MQTKPEVLFLYRTAKKRRYFSSLKCNALRGLEVEVKAYHGLPRPQPALRRLSQPNPKTLDALVAKAERQFLHSRRGPLVRVVRWLVRPLLRSLLATLYRRLYCYLQTAQPTAVAIWNGMKVHDHVLHAVNRQMQIPLIYFENGVLPNTTTLDFKGINAGGSVPTDATVFQQYPNQSPDLDIINERQYRSKRSTSTLPETYILVPFQQDRDSQILDYSDWVTSMRELFRICCEARKEAGLEHLPLVFREHPSSRARYQDLHELARHQPNVHFDTSGTLKKVIANAQFVITINSTVGLHAMLAGVPVIVLGRALYRIDKLVLVAESIKDLSSAMQQASEFDPDPDLRDRFWYFLANVYAVPGSWQQPDANHFESARERILQQLRIDPSPA